MDDAELEKIREIARQNNIDPDDLLAAVGSNPLPDTLQEAILTALGDLAVFGKALDNADK